MNINCGNICVAGYYTFELNGKRVFEAPSKNLITDFGWNRLFNLSSQAVGGLVVQVGTSNTPPANTDTALGSLLATKTGAGSATIGTASDVNGNYSYSRYPFVFTLGAVVGNVAEVGFKVATGDASLTSRSLVKDGLGNPAVITVTASDQLTVNYELRYYRAVLDITSTVTVAGVPTTYVFRTATAVNGTVATSGYLGGFNPPRVNITHYASGTFGAAGVDIGGSGTAVPSLTPGSLVIDSGTGVISFTTSTIGTASGNPGGSGIAMCQFYMADPATGNFSLGAYGNLKASFSPAIPKDATKIMSYSFSFTFTRL